jgi:Tol biopolymer transport system component
VTFRQVTPDCTYFSGSYGSLNAAGSRVAFESNCNLLGRPGWTGNTEIFVTDLDGANAIEVTRADSPSGGSHNPALNASGNLVAFMSFDELIPGQNTDWNSEIFLARVDPPALRQLTDTTGGEGGYLAHWGPALDATGRLVAFSTNYDPTSGNADMGHTELFIVSSDGSGLRRLTETPDGRSSQAPAFDGSGRYVYFVSDADWNGQNPDRSGEVFRIQVETAAVEQVSSNLPAQWFPWGPSSSLSVSASGERVALVGGFTDQGFFHEDAFVLDVRSGVVTRVTSTSGGRGCWTVSLSANGRRLAVSCDRDLVPGRNSNGNYQIFIADLGF